MANNINKQRNEQMKQAPVGKPVIHPDNASRRPDFYAAMQALQSIPVKREDLPKRNAASDASNKLSLELGASKKIAGSFLNPPKKG